MVAPTAEQICCIVGNTPLYRHFQPKLPPTVNCRNSKIAGTTLTDHPSLLKSPQVGRLPLPPRQWHIQPSLNAPPGHIPCSTPKEMLRMAHKPTFGEPAGQFWCAIVLERKGKGRGKVGRHKKRWPQDHLSYYHPDRSSGRILLFRNTICSMQ